MKKFNMFKKEKKRKGWGKLLVSIKNERRGEITNVHIYIKIILIHSKFHTNAHFHKY